MDARMHKQGKFYLGTKGWMRWWRLFNGMSLMRGDCRVSDKKRRPLVVIIDQYDSLVGVLEL
jgi:hypothetical protein